MYICTHQFTTKQLFMQNQITEAIELMPLLVVKDANHRLGVIVTIDRDKVKSKVNEMTSSWIHARKGKLPSFFTLVFSHIDSKCRVWVDNYCNIIEDGDGLERGECTMVFDNGILVELHDLN